MGTNLWEVRISLPTRRIARILLFIDDSALVLVNAFIKKTQKTPSAEIDLARKRKQSYYQTVGVKKYEQA